MAIPATPHLYSSWIFDYAFGNAAKYGQKHQPYPNEPNQSNGSDSVQFNITHTQRMQLIGSG